MAKPVTITLNGRRWRVARPRKITIEGEDCHGSCSQATRSIEVLSHLTGLKELVILLHEIRHALNDYLDESYVETESEDVGAALHKLGYRRLTPAQMKQLGID